MAFQPHKIKKIVLILAIVIIAAVSANIVYSILKSGSESDLAFKESLRQLDQQLTQGYPDFLKKADKVLLDYKINYYQKKENYSKDEVQILWKLLYIKKHFYKHDYLSEQTRKNFVSKIAKQETDNFLRKYFQINILKYKLGMNNISELENYLGEQVDICHSDNLFLEQTDWNNVWQVGVYFDIVHFCKIAYGQQEIEKLNFVLKNNDLSSNSHLREHGINDVPVYVNDCDQAQNINEKYHCLFFN